MAQKKKSTTSARPATMSEAKIAVRKLCGKVGHDAKQAHRNYSYTSHEAVTNSVVPAMHEVGITHRFKCKDLQIDSNFAIFKMTVTFWYDDYEEKVSVYAGDKLRDGTSMGAITSYAMKVALLKFFGLNTGEKDLEQIQAEQEAVNAALLQQKAQEVKKAEENKEADDFDFGPAAAVQSKESESTEAIFNGTRMCSVEQQSEFTQLCKEFNLTDEMIDKRLEFEGVASLDHVPEAVMTDWIDSMVSKLEDADA